MLFHQLTDTTFPDHQGKYREFCRFDGVFVVREFLAVRVRQSRKAAHAHPAEMYGHSQGCGRASFHALQFRKN